jgi:hypothetical protein
MPVFPVSHFTWQCLRVAKRCKAPPTGRLLRFAPSRKTKDGTFLNNLVDQGLLRRITGTADQPFEATYALTERGEYAAEYGECEFPAKAAIPTAQSSPLKKKTKGTDRVSR